MDEQTRKTKRRLEQWRRRHGGRGRIPEGLWAEAVEQAMAHGVERTADLLGLNATVLARRVDEHPRGAPESAETEPTPRFVELPLGRIPASSACTVEAEDSEGRRLKIQLSGEASSQIVSVARALWPACACPHADREGQG